MRDTLQQIKTILELVFLVVVLGVIVGVGYHFITTKTLPDQSFGWKFPVAKFPPTGSSQNLVAYSDIRDPGGVPQGLPVRLQIPAIGVDSTIEDALITPDGRMDVPAGSVNVAWFALGPHPGQVGSAVIGGHFGIENGVPFVFYNLDKLKVGDKIYIVDDKNNSLAFIVRSTKSFDRNADSTTVFTSSDGLAHLNLITCEGIWNQVNGTYPQRLVIFTDAIPSEGSVVVTKQPQIAAKLPVTAIATPTPSTHPLPSAQASSQPMPTPTQISSSGLYGLYATPIDGLITSLLLLSIVVVVFKILRR